jgi:hypothetical protein
MATARKDTTKVVFRELAALDIFAFPPKTETFLSGTCWKQYGSGFPGSSSQVSPDEQE